MLIECCIYQRTLEQNPFLFNEQLQDALGHIPRTQPQKQGARPGEQDQSSPSIFAIREQHVSRAPKMQDNHQVLALDRRFN